MRTPLIKLVVLAAAVAAGCKGETKTVDNPQTADDLKKCQEAKAEKDKLITQLTDEKAQWMRDKGAAAGDIVVSIEGNILTVKPAPTGVVPRLDDKQAREASNQFIDRPSDRSEDRFGRACRQRPGSARFDLALTVGDDDAYV